MSDYDLVQKGSLKLKGVSDGGIKKKKKKKQEQKHLEQVSKTKIEEEPVDVTKISISSKTKAEQAFTARMEKLATERVLAKAEKSHKQRVEEFNAHLDTLTEHFDIPKVSWTK